MKKGFFILLTFLFLCTACQMQEKNTQISYETETSSLASSVNESASMKEEKKEEEKNLPASSKNEKKETLEPAASASKSQEEKYAQYQKSEIYLDGKKVNILLWKHTDHYHLVFENVEYVITEKQYKQLLDKNNTFYFYPKTRRLMQKSNPSSLQNQVIKSQESERVEKIDAKSIVSTYKHGDHWHVKLADGSEYIVYEDPTEKKDLETVESKVEIGIVHTETEKGILFSKVLRHGNLYYVLYNEKAYILESAEYHRALEQKRFEAPSLVTNDEWKKKLRLLAEQTHLKEDEIAYKDKIFYTPHEDHLHLVNYDSISLNDQESQILARLSPEEQEEIRKKKEYLVYVFGKTHKGTDAVPLEAIRLYEHEEELYFSYNEPMMEYDPTHVHPVSVLVERVIIPERSTDLEIDYLNELEATAIRVHIIPEELRVENGRFLIPHGSHDHSIKIQSQGYEIYEQNKLTVPRVARQEGPLDVKEMIETVNDLLLDAEERLSDKEYRRVLRALEYFEYKIKRNHRQGFSENSTEGYKEALRIFSRKYIYKTDTADEIKTEEDLLVEAEVKKIEHLLKDSSMLHTSDVGGIEKRVILASVQAAEETKNLAQLQEIKAYVEKLQALHARPSILLMSYTEFFLRHLEQASLEDSLKNEMAYLIIEMNEPTASKHLFARILQAYARVKGKANVFEVPLFYTNYEERPLKRLESPKMGSFGTFKEDITQMVDSVRDMLEIIP